GRAGARVRGDLRTGKRRRRGCDAYGHPAAGMTIRLLIADDHPVVRAGVRGMLESQPDFEIVAEASNGRQAVDLARELRPDVVLMDLRMQGELDGVAAIKR